VDQASFDMFTIECLNGAEFDEIRLSATYESVIGVAVNASDDNKKSPSERALNSANPR